MNAIQQDLASLHWWITVVLVALILNVAASYFRDGLDKLLPRFSSRLKFWARRKTAEFSQDINSATGDLSVMTFLAARQAGYHVGALHNYVLMGLFFYMGGKVKSPEWVSITLWFIALIFSSAAASNFGRAMRCKTILDEVQKKLKQATTAAPTPG